jgi:hypothetical protein
MMNGREINGEIGSGPMRRKGAAGVVAEVVAKYRGSPRKIYDELFLMTVSRRATPEEVARLNDVRDGTTIRLGASGDPASKGARPPAIAIPGTGADDVAFYQDVFWALLNSNEFILNH